MGMFVCVETPEPMLGTRALDHKTYKVFAHAMLLQSLCNQCLSEHVGIEIVVKHIVIHVVVMPMIHKTHSFSQLRFLPEGRGGGKEGEEGQTKMNAQRLRGQTKMNAHLLRD